MQSHEPPYNPEAEKDIVQESWREFMTELRSLGEEKPDHTFESRMTGFAGKFVTDPIECGRLIRALEAWLLRQYTIEEAEFLLRDWFMRVFLDFTRTMHSLTPRGQLALFSASDSKIPYFPYKEITKAVYGEDGK